MLFGLRTGRVFLLIALFVLPALFSGGVPSVHAQQISTVSIYPLKSSTTAYDPAAPPTYFNVSLRLLLDRGVLLNLFDIIVDYSSSSASAAVVQPVKIDTSNNIFGSGGVPAVECVDGNGVNNVPCEPNDHQGQVHVVMGIAGGTVNGGFTNGPLFNVTFKVVGSGYSVFTISQANLFDPGSTPPANPHLIPLIVKNGVWGNNGLVPFFNFWSKNDYPVLLPNNPVLFDASGSFNASNTQTKISNYSWQFGDGGLNTTSSSVVFHNFTRPGQYYVQLTITANGKTMAGSESVVVAPTLGSLLLFVKDDVKGGVLRGNVYVQASNATWRSAINVTDFNGEVVSHNLSPGNYTVRFLGPTVLNSTKVETVFPGITYQDYIFLTVLSLPPDNGGSGWILVWIFLGGLAAMAVAIVVKRRTFRRSKKAGSTGPTKSAGARNG